MLFINNRFITIDFTLVQTELVDVREMLDMNVNRDFEITEQEKQNYYKYKADSLFSYIDIFLNDLKLNFELIKLDYFQSQIRTFYYRAYLPDSLVWDKADCELLVKSKIPYDEKDKFLYYIQTGDSVYIENITMFGDAPYGVIKEEKDPPNIRIEYFIDYKKLSMYYAPVLAAKIKSGEIESTNIKVSTDKVLKGFAKLKEVITSKEITPGLFAFLIVLSLVLGGLHALTPGHGKTIIAAYFVGTKGRLLDAIILGLVTTFSHTFSVILLGLIVLYASKYVLPQTLFPYLELLSGILVAGVGIWLIITRAKSPTGFESHSHKHSHIGDNGKIYYHTHSHNHSNHLHKDENYNQIEHIDKYHEIHNHNNHDINTGKKFKRINTGVLISLGFSGGIVPCPDALILLLIAIAINRIGLGLLILFAFSFGLAFVLIFIGIIMVVARPLFEKLSGSGKVLRYLPVISSFFITAIGFYVILKAILKFLESIFLKLPRNVKPQ